MTFSPAQNTDSEGAILFDLKRFSLDDGPGPRTVLFFQGCPLACPWCHNPEGVPLSGPLLFRKENCGDCAKACVTEALIQLGRFYPFQEIYETIGRDLDLLLEGGGGVTATGGESLLQLPALVEIFRWCKNRGIHTLLETSGHGADNLEELLEVTDEVYLDLKFPDAARYKEIGGKLDLVRAFAEKIAQAKIPLSIRMPVIPGYNDSDADLLEAAKLAWSWEGVKNFVLLPYHPWGKDKYQALALPFITENKAMSPQKLREKIAKLEKAGYSATF